MARAPGRARARELSPAPCCRLRSPHGRQHFCRIPLPHRSQRRNLRELFPAWGRRSRFPRIDRIRTHANEPAELSRRQSQASSVGTQPLRDKANLPRRRAASGYVWRSLLKPRDGPSQREHLPRQRRYMALQHCNCTSVLIGRLLGRFGCFSNFSTRQATDFVTKDSGDVGHLHLKEKCGR